MQNIWFDKKQTTTTISGKKNITRINGSFCYRLLLSGNTWSLKYGILSIFVSLTMSINKRKRIAYFSFLVSVILKQKLSWRQISIFFKKIYVAQCFEIRLHKNALYRTICSSLLLYFQFPSKWTGEKIFLLDLSILMDIQSVWNRWICIRRQKSAVYHASSIYTGKWNSISHVLHIVKYKIIQLLRIILNE